MSRSGYAEISCGQRDRGVGEGSGGSSLGLCELCSDSSSEPAGAPLGTWQTIIFPGLLLINLRSPRSQGPVCPWTSVLVDKEETLKFKFSGKNEHVENFISHEPKSVVSCGLRLPTVSPTLLCNFSIIQQREFKLTELSAMFSSWLSLLKGILKRSTRKKC